MFALGAGVVSKTNISTGLWCRREERTSGFEAGNRNINHIITHFIIPVRDHFAAVLDNLDISRYNISIFHSL